MLMDKNTKEIGLKINNMGLEKKNSQLLFMKGIFKMDLNMEKENLLGNKMGLIMMVILKMELFKDMELIIIKMEENILDNGKILK